MQIWANFASVLFKSLFASLHKILESIWHDRYDISSMLKIFHWTWMENGLNIVPLSFACLCPIHSQGPIRSFREPVITETNYQYKLQHPIVINRTKLCRMQDRNSSIITIIHHLNSPNACCAKLYSESQSALGGIPTVIRRPPVSHLPSSKPCFGDQETHRNTLMHPWVIQRFKWVGDPEKEALANLSVVHESEI